jgi:hypothetical protein
MTPRLALAILLAAGLAGCLGGDREDGPPGPTPSLTSTGTGSSSSTTTGPPAPLQVLDLLLAFEFTECSGISVHHERPIEQVQALLPEGFTAAPAPDAPTPTPGVGVLAVDLFACGNLTTAAVAVPQTYLGLVYTYIERPTDRLSSAPDATVHEYVFRLLAGTDVLATLWPAAGYSTYSGDANVTVGPPLEPDPLLGPLVPDPLARFGQASVANGDDLGTGYFLVATGMQLAPLAAARTQTFARYTLHVDGDGSVLVWTGTYELPTAARGPGSAEVAADDPFAVYAPPEAQALAGIASQYDAGAIRGQDLRRVFTTD